MTLGVRYEYKVFLLRQGELQGNLNSLGATGWRLHTCEPMLDNGCMMFTVVMDRVVETSEEQRGEPQAMAVRG